MGSIIDYKFTSQAQASDLPFAFYITWLWAIGLIILLGFIPSYILQFSSLTRMHHWHGALSFAWVAGMISQATLIYQKRLIPHRTLGYCLTFVLLAFIISTVVLYITVYQERITTSVIFRLVLSLDIALFPLFIFFMYRAIFSPGSSLKHAHWVLLASVMLLPPGLGRLIHGLFFFPFDLPPRYFYEPTVIITGLILYRIGQAQSWQFKSTRVCLVAFISAVLISYAVAYDITKESIPWLS
ncbi:hypothetical protein [Pseudoalteromonas sp. R3]|uniref:hypothetical protein n=1 Tax=Pseudoalteromonas sp. R3 TaxID=1709477 RepID=UPI0006B4969A|nr:hypothetical protein [Pseudoalteromonas sp. R3]AZZ97832.1 hypothetical protein ELR70_12335 [Pseudoalteromonas sp. R3]